MPSVRPRPRQHYRPQLPAPSADGIDPYRSLVLMVFQRAVEDAHGRTAPPANRRADELKQEAQDWLASDDPARWLALAGLEPDAVLPKVRQSLGPG